MKQRLFFGCIAWMLLFTFVAVQSWAAPDRQPKDPKNPQNKQGSQGPQGEFKTDVPQHDFDIILGRATQHEVTLSILIYQDGDGFVEYGEKPAEFQSQTKPIAFKNGNPVEIVVKELRPNTRYYYRFAYRKAGSKDFMKSPMYVFNTQRSPGSSFVFDVQADPHLDENTSPEVYQQTLRNELTAGPDFLVDLGDTFMTNKYRGDFRESFRQYLAQRYYFGMVCHSAPLYLTLGNHDGEGWVKNSSPDNMTFWATTIRKKFYPNPVPDGFYTGNNTSETLAGLPQNYYAWEWGDALFIVLDPFRYTQNDEPWGRTLGEKQYRWLKQTLETSKAKFKFVFIHNLVGGADLNGKARGGAEVAKLYEWGGLNLDGSEGFAQHRPGWEKPIHQLLAENHVSVVFHGHDHFFAKQELDGIIYQMGPQPGSSKGNLGRVEEYGYLQGVFLPGGGYLRITVSSAGAKVDYIRTDNGKNGAVEYSYIVK